MAERAPRTPPHLLPNWTLSFILPFELPFVGLNEGQHPNLIGVRIGPLQRVEVIGKNKQWLISQAVKLIRRTAPNWVGDIRVHFQRDREVHPSTLSGPGRAPQSQTGRLIINYRSQQLMFGHSLRAFTETEVA